MSPRSYFDDSAAARSRLVVEHPLQPFGHAAQPDARRMRFDTAWAQALGTSPAAHPLPPFVAARLIDETEPAPPAGTIDYQALRRFFIDAPRIFLRDRLRNAARRRRGAPARSGAVRAGRRAREGSACSAASTTRLLADASIDEATLCRRLQAEAPASARRRRRDAPSRDRAAGAADRARRARGAIGRRAHAAVRAAARRHRDSPACSTMSTTRTRCASRSASRADAMSCAGISTRSCSPRSAIRARCSRSRDFEPGDVGPRTLAAHPSGAARAALRWLVGVMREGLAAPLRSARSTAWAWLEDFAKSADAGARRRRRRRSVDQPNGDGEGTDAATVLALRGATPFEDETATLRVSLA